MAVEPLVAPEGFTFERLHSADHDCSGFSCGVDDLDRFLRDRAAKDQQRNLSASWILAEQLDPAALNGPVPVIGFITLVGKEIPFDNAPKAITRITKRASVPALLLARMGVDTRYHRRGLGEFLLTTAFHRACEMASLGGCMAIVVDAKDEQVKAFYMKYKFEPFPDRPLRLFILTATIQKAIG